VFGLDDIPRFLFSFLLIVPIVSIIHQSGHSFMALLFGGQVNFTIGKGKTIFKWKKIKLKSIYFLDSVCVYEKLKYDNRFSHACVYAGGSLANLASIFIVNSLIESSFFTANLFFYQFVYFSVYYTVFSLLPVRFSENSSSDGQAIFDVLRHGKASCNPD